MKIFKTYRSLIIVFLAFPFYMLNVTAFEYSVKGIVLDKESGKAVPGASIRIAGTNKGTYSSSGGKFRLPFISGNVTLNINSIGYESENIEIEEPNNDTLVILLQPRSVNLEGVEKTAAIEPDEIIRRAIRRKQENLSKIRTFKGLLYSKLLFELNGSPFTSASSSGNKLAVSAAVGDKKENDKFQYFILESFSDIMKDYDKQITRTFIKQRKQTANIVPDNNVMAITDFVNFYDENIKFLNTEMITPLNKDALSYYDFRLLEKSILGDRYVYILEVKPKTELIPLFEGTIKIVEGTYNLVELELKTSKQTAIAFIRNVSLMQKFKEVEKDIWHPGMLEVKGKANVEVVKGLVDIEMDLTATSIYNELQVNVPLPDSIYKTTFKRTTSVSATADSAKNEFWEQNSMREISEREKEIYTKVDSIVVRSDSLKKNASPWSFSWLSPYINFNRVTSAEIGLSPSLSYRRNTLSSDIFWSFGLRRPAGKLELEIPLSGRFRSRLSLTGSVFSHGFVSSANIGQSLLVNSLTSTLFHYDNYNFHLQEGWNAVFKYDYRKFYFRAYIEYSNHSPLSKTTNRSLFVNTRWRENPDIISGFYRVERFNASYELELPWEAFRDFTFRSELMGLNGDNITKDISFTSVHGNFHFNIPLIRTVYTPIRFKTIFKSELHPKIPRRNISSIFLQRDRYFRPKADSILLTRECSEAHHFIMHMEYSTSPIFSGAQQDCPFTKEEVSICHSRHQQVDISIMQTLHS